tara:strand:- start:3211 stop:3726 length:516 start_codon:yes stop_codon:yes gene_type:complete
MIDERYEDGDYMFADCPDNWVVLEILGSDDNGAATFTYKVLAGWSGGYLHGDNWKLNSGIVKVRELADAWVFIGNSGSEYICDKEQYKLRMNNADIYEKMITAFPHTIRMMPEDTDWSTLFMEYTGQMTDYDSVTRIEVIDQSGRAWITNIAEGVTVSLQDDNRTLKLFVK